MAQREQPAGHIREAGDQPAAKSEEPALEHSRLPRPGRLAPAHDAGSVGLADRH
jgi:hypothetical protein